MNESSTETDTSSAQLTPAEMQLLATDEFSQYFLHAPSEMTSIFRSLAERVEQVSLIFNEGKDMVLSSLISYNAEGLILEYGANADINRRALQASRLFCVSQLDKVKIQFIVSGLVTTQVDGRPAFYVKRPDSVLRLQRRENYRLVTPIMHQPKCKIRFSAIDGKEHVIEAGVGDISGGGVCLVGLPSSLPLALDMELVGCTIELPEIGPITATLKLRSFRPVTSRMGENTQRAGFQFIGLSGTIVTLIQRYIIKVERDRKARESGLG